MSKLFAKYLPVEGEIKEYDQFLADGRLYTFFGFDGAKSSVNTVESGFIYHSANNSAIEWLAKQKKVKLFLCSRDIIEDDDIYYTLNGELKGTIKAPKHIEKDSPFINMFKKVGEISPEAVFCKEGDEFDEEDWRWALLDDINGSISVLYDKDDSLEEDLLEDYRIVIKGPCGHFH